MAIGEGLVTADFGLIEAPLNSPDADVRVVAEAVRRGLVSLPGIATPTEAFAALKLFPAEAASPALPNAPGQVHSADGARGGGTRWRYR